MRQSTIIFGTLLAAFVIYITLRGQLPDYFALFTGAPSTSGDTTSAEIIPSETAKTSGTSNPLKTGDFQKTMDSLLGKGYV